MRYLPKSCLKCKLYGVLSLYLSVLRILKAINKTLLKMYLSNLYWKLAKLAFDYRPL